MQYGVRDNLEHVFRLAWSPLFPIETEYEIHLGFPPGVMYLSDQTMRL